MIARGCVPSKRLSISTLSRPYVRLDGVTTVPSISRASSRNGPPGVSNRNPERAPTVQAPSATPAARSRNSRRSIALHPARAAGDHEARDCRGRGEDTDGEREEKQRRRPDRDAPPRRQLLDGDQ